VFVLASEIEKQGVASYMVLPLVTPCFLLATAQFTTQLKKHIKEVQNQDSGTKVGFCNQLML
jgi:hypothetical protein